jgi:hypothetical protein
MIVRVGDARRQTRSCKKLHKRQPEAVVSIPQICHQRCLL